MLKILFLTSEVTPFSRTGRQGDLVSALAPALKRGGHEVRVVTPRYDDIRERRFGLREVARLKDLIFNMGNSSFSASIKSGFIPCSKVQLYFIETPAFNHEVASDAVKAWNDPFLTALQLIHGGLQLTSHLQWLPDIIYCCGRQMALAPVVIRTDPIYKDLLSDSRVILQFFSDSTEDTFDQQFLAALELPEEDFTSFNSFEELGRHYADSIVEPKGTIGEWLEFLTHREDGVFSGLSDDPELIDNNSKNVEFKISHKAALQAKLGLPIEPDLPLVALWSGGAEIDKMFKMLEAELPLIEAQLVAFGGDDSTLERTMLWSSRNNGKVASVHKDPNETLRHIEQAADILFIPHVDSAVDTFSFCRKFFSAVPLLTEDLFATEGLGKNYQIPNYAHSFVFPSGDTRAMIEALRKTTETYKNPLDWNELVQRGINRELCCEHIARNMAEDFNRLLENKPAAA